MDEIKKVLILGSGPLQIGQAGEFDYSGSQAITALKEEGVEVVIVNPNIATVQTDEKLAHRIYFLPITPYFVEKVIVKERPQGVLLGFGGQTALNCGVELQKSGVFKKYGVEILGTPIKAIEETEDRALFAKRMSELGIPVPKSAAVTSVEAAVKAAERIGWPVMARAAYTLGGKGSGVARSEAELRKIAEQAFNFTPQLLVERYVGGWKEIEYEVVRDADDNCITVCNIENIDPMGIHTGESIVVAPSQTLSNSEYHRLRETAIKVIRALGVVGECNIQYALDPHSEQFYVIEVNARLSRSSALASKATGYPLAYIAAKLALGKKLTELPNSITKVTKACFEPALDYVVVKIPKWDLGKFRNVERKIGSVMKSVGEVMAVGRSFEEALQKGLRMQGGSLGFAVTRKRFDDLADALRNPTDKRIYAVAEALRKGWSVERIAKESSIDKWFISRMATIIEKERELKRTSLEAISPEDLLDAKKLGFSDKQLASLWGKNEAAVRAKRWSVGIRPWVKQIDTLAAEFPAQTNYLYLTYHADSDDTTPLSGSIIILGSGPYKIGSSVEFDWCTTNAAFTARAIGRPTIVLNHNPETVSTDHSTCDKLYFDEISLETILEIFSKESASGVVVSFGGQIANDLALSLHSVGIPLLGTSAESIDVAEDRKKFSKLCDAASIDQPEWVELTSRKKAERWALSVGFPILIRPSYVLSGAAMGIAWDAAQLHEFLEKAANVSSEHPVVLTKFILNAKELEFDGVANRGDVIASAVSEHIENAGVHSGDATMVLPPQKTYSETMSRIKTAAAKIAKGLMITGPFNIQFIAKDNDVKVIECNLRASRSFPFASKALGINLVDFAVRAMLGAQIPVIPNGNGCKRCVAVKMPMFSYSRLKGADPVSGVEMRSTGEAGCLGGDVYDALLKAFLSVGYELPKKNVLVSISGEETRCDFLKSIRRLRALGFRIFATSGTAAFLKENDIPANVLHKIQEKERPNVGEYIEQRRLDFAIVLPHPYKPIETDKKYDLRRLAIDYNIPLISNLQLAKVFVKSLSIKKLDDLSIKSWNEFMGNGNGSVKCDGKIDR